MHPTRTQQELGIFWGIDLLPDLVQLHSSVQTQQPVQTKGLEIGNSDELSFFEAIERTYQSTNKHTKHERMQVCRQLRIGTSYNERPQNQTKSCYYLVDERCRNGYVGSRISREDTTSGISVVGALKEKWHSNSIVKTVYSIVIHQENSGGCQERA